MEALILVDLQNDFMPGGALAVPEGDRVVPLANLLAHNFDLVLATQDWHPAGHASFAASHPGRQPGDVIELGGIPQILWPTHCVQETPGAAFHKDFDTRPIARIFRKGTDPAIDSYSTFFDNRHLKSTGLGEYLHERGVRDLCIAGLATDYCVKYSVLDALGLGLRATVVSDACRGVNLRHEDDLRALQELHEAGARIITSGQLHMLRAA